MRTTKLDKQYYSHFCKICRTYLNELKGYKCTECYSDDIEVVYYTLQDETNKMVWTYIPASELIDLASSIYHNDPNFNFHELPLSKAIEALETNEYDVTLQEWIYTMTEQELEMEGCKCGNRGLYQLDINEFECGECKKVYRIVN
ncbi:hypothetical protein [Niallia sp. MER 6]|uniref:hypothetical protein n=1 Tax=Niallia sp. MER 6 TaxID=2939567 RepID=UPI002041A7AC|nr:hypothetical protein [Niallia sp. MER 6]